MTILLSSCRKEKFGEPVQPLNNAVSAFDSENSCLDEIIPSQIDAYQRELAADIYGNLISARSEYLEFGTPVWPGVVTYIDSSTLNHRLNLVPLIDEDTDSVSALLFIDIAGQYYNAFFVSKKAIIHEQFDSLESVLGENIYSIRQLEILELFECFECLLYCRNLSVVTRDPDPKCPKWKDKPRRGRFRRGNGGGNGSNDPNDFTVYVWWGNGRSLYSYANSGSTPGSGSGSNGTPTYSPGQFKPRIENCDGLGDIYDTGPNNPLNGHPDSAFCLALHELRECVPSIGDDSDIIDWFLWYDTYYDNQAWEGMQNFACTNKLPPDIKDEAIRWFIENAYQGLLVWSDYNSSLITIQGLFLKGVDISLGELTCLVDQPFSSERLDDFMMDEIMQNPEIEGIEMEAVEFASAAIDLLCSDPSMKVVRMIELNDILKTNPNALIENCFSPNAVFDISYWQDLASFTIPQNCLDRLESLAGNWSDQSILMGNTPRVNLDWFPVNITTFPLLNGQQLDALSFFEYVRKNFPAFANGGAEINSIFLGTFEANWEFKYLDSNYDSPQWNSSAPVTTIFTIDTDASIPLAPEDDGSVIVSSFDPGACWLFSTVKAPQTIYPQDGYHPVSGNRQFGLKINGDGTYTFYTKAADRARISPVFKALAFLQGMNAEEEFYILADETWNSLQDNVVDFINNNGGNATIGPAIAIRPQWERVKDILRSNAPLNQIPCHE